MPLNELALRKLRFCRWAKYPISIGIKGSIEFLDSQNGKCFYLKANDMTQPTLTINGTTVLHPFMLADSGVEGFNQNTYAMIERLIPPSSYGPRYINYAHAIVGWSGGDNKRSLFKYAASGLPGYNSATPPDITSATLTFTMDEGAPSYSFQTQNQLYAAAGGTFHVVMLVKDVSEQTYPMNSAGDMALYTDLGTTAVGNLPPVCSMNSVQVEGMTVTVTVSAYDPDAGDAVTALLITWGDGTTTSVPVYQGGQVYTHTYSAPGTYGVFASTTDTHNAVGQSTPVQVVVDVPNQPPMCSFTTLVAENGYTVQINANASSDPDGAITAWRYDPGDGNGWQSGVVGFPATHTYPRRGRYMLTVEVTDNEDATAQQQAEVVIDPAMGRACILLPE